MTDKITFELDGRSVEAEPGESIWQVAQRHGTTIPHLCWSNEPGYAKDGNCRACMVEIEGERVLAASCQRPLAPSDPAVQQVARLYRWRRPPDAQTLICTYYSESKEPNTCKGRCLGSPPLDGEGLGAG